jgi:hypothetical protein
LLTRTGAAAALLVLLVAVGNAGAAPAALQVTSMSHVLGGITAATIVTRQDPAAYRTTLSAPAAYQLPNVGHVGRRVGTAVVNASTDQGEVTFAGWITGLNPAGYSEDDCAAFAGYAHEAVWLMQVRQTDGIAHVEIPIFVDAGPGGTTELSLCAAAAADMTITGVTLHLNGALKNPVVHGAYPWRAHFDLALGGACVLGVHKTSAVAVVRL